MRSRKREFVKSYDIFDSIKGYDDPFEELNRKYDERNRNTNGNIKILTKEETRALLNLPAAKDLR